MYFFPLTIIFFSWQPPSPSPCPSLSSSLKSLLLLRCLLLSFSPFSFFTCIFLSVYPPSLSPFHSSLPSLLLPSLRLPPSYLRVSDTGGDISIFLSCALLQTQWPWTIGWEFSQGVGSGWDAGRCTAQTKIIHFYFRKSRRLRDKEEGRKTGRMGRDKRKERKGFFFLYVKNCWPKA